MIFKDRNSFLSFDILFHLAAMHPSGTLVKQQSEEIEQQWKELMNHESPFAAKH